MDKRTSAAYDRHASSWIAARGPDALTTRRLARFVGQLRKGAPVADLGSGPGWYAHRLRQAGHAGLALDLTHEMLAETGRKFPGVPRVRADLAGLPFGRSSLGGAWAINCLSHLPVAELPTALAHLHHALEIDAPLECTFADLEALDATAAELRRGTGQRRFPDDSFGKRLFTAVSEQQLRFLLESAGFDRIQIERPGQRRFWLWVRARRAYTLPDYTRPGLRVLVCGLNPSLAAADTGIPFVGASNRFWPAALRAGLVERTRDPWDALRLGVGFTDLVKRATRSASTVQRQEYASGLARLERGIRSARPNATCFVGLDGWRRAVDPKAFPGWIEGGFAGRPAYLMPSTSGRNAHVDLAGLARHLGRAAREPTG